MGDDNLNFGDREEEKILKTVSDNIQAALERIVLKIELEKINKIIDDIPEMYQGIKIMSLSMKEYYKVYLKERYEKILIPALERTKELKGKSKVINQEQKQVKKEI